MAANEELPEGVENCPTCGRFASMAEGYADLPPGGVQNHDYLVPYCDAACAERKPVPCTYENEAQS